MKKVIIIVFLVLSCLSNAIFAQVSTTGCTLNGGMSIYTACNNGQGCTSGCNLSATYSGFGPMCNGTSVTGNCFGSSTGQQVQSTSFSLPSGCTANITVEMKKRTGGCSNSGADAGDYINISGSGGSSSPPAIQGDNSQNSCCPVSGGNYDALINYIKVGGTFVITMSANRSDEIATWTINLSGTCGPGCSGVLPISLTDFYAKPNENSVQLNWHVEVEENVNYYQIERSTDGINFVPISKVSSIAGAAGKFNLNYNTTDFSPSQGINYYRLVNVDLDGSKQYNRLIMVNFNQSHSNDVWINQTETDVVISFENTFKDKTFYLLDMNGKKIGEYKNINIDLNYFTIDKLNLPKGLYVIGCLDGLMPPQKLLIN